MVNNPSIKKISKSTNVESIIDRPEPPVGILSPVEEEKVEVLIKESILINPRDFSAFKHALEEFVDSWDK